MKDMSVEDLLNHLGDIAFYGDAEHWNKAAHELLRRFEVLEKELESWRNSRDGVMAEVEDAALRVRNLACCGNCKNTSCSDRYRIGNENMYCSNWLTDGLSREEREGK